MHLLEVKFTFQHSMDSSYLPYSSKFLGGEDLDQKCFENVGNH